MDCMNCCCKLLDDESELIEIFSSALRITDDIREEDNKAALLIQRVFRGYGLRKSQWFYIVRVRQTEICVKSVVGIPGRYLQVRAYGKVFDHSSYSWRSEEIDIFNVWTQYNGGKYFRTKSSIENALGSLLPRHFFIYNECGKIVLRHDNNLQKWMSSEELPPPPPLLTPPTTPPLTPPADESSLPSLPSLSSRTPVSTQSPYKSLPQLSPTPQASSLKSLPSVSSLLSTPESTESSPLPVSARHSRYLMATHVSRSYLLSPFSSPDGEDQQLREVFISEKNIIEPQIVQVLWPQRRKNQDKFRKEVLDRCWNECVVTGVKVVSVLQAAHIVPYEDREMLERKGLDVMDAYNGIALRADLHILFDNFNLWVSRGSDGILRWRCSEEVAEYLPNVNFKECGRAFPADSIKYLDMSGHVR